MSTHSEPNSVPDTDAPADGRGNPEDIAEWKNDAGESANLMPCTETLENDSSRDEFTLAVAKLRQTEIEEEATYELKRLELERRVNKAKRHTELLRLQTLMGKKTEETFPDVTVRNNVSIHRPSVDYANSQGLSMAQPSLSDILCRLDLPKLELPSFNGEQREYWNFIRQFEAQVEGKVADESLRLSYLLSCCRDRARRLIEGCSMLPLGQGYAAAKNILTEMFGRPFVVARSLIDELIHGRPVNNSADDLMEFAIKMQNCELALCQIGRDTELNSIGNMEAIIRRLPPELQRKWVEHASDIGDNREPSFSDLKAFLERRAKVANSMYSQLLGFSATTNKATTSSGHATVLPNRRCGLCNLSHDLVDCKRFSAMDGAERLKYIARVGRCFVCLGQGHVASSCLKGSKCPVVGCGKKHHGLLHNDDIKVGDNIVNLNEQVSNAESLPVRRVCLGIIPVRLTGPSGSHVTYALLDNGSDATLVDAAIAGKLGLPGHSTVLNMRSVNNARSVNTKRVGFLVESLDSCGSVDIQNAYAIENLSVGVGCFSRQMDIDRWGHLRELRFERLPDTRIGLLIGCDVPEVHWSIEERVGSRKQPFAKRTVLGWILLGPLDQNLEDCISNSNMNAQCVEQLLEKLYDTEFRDIGEDVAYSLEDKAAMAQVSDSIRLIDGHFEIGLPWRKDKRELPNNWTTATRRLHQLSRRFIRDPELKEAYCAVIRRHIDRGHIVPVPENQLQHSYSPRWYLPHHAVVNPKKPGKLRVVFDCASRHLGVSLNDYLLQGPNLTTNLVEVLLRFREGRVAMMSDIQEMFMQVRVPQDDRGALRLLWWEDGNTDGVVREWQMAVHPFGAASSPFCAAMALRKSLDISEVRSDDLVREAIERNFYVDDCLISLDSVSEASGLASKLTEAVNLAGFRLVKWSSNEPKTLNGLQVSELSEVVRNITLGEGHIERTLGLEWDIANDQFLFPVSLPERPATRRGILSCVSSLYDPLGLVAPILLPAKMLLQGFCRQNLGWDDKISEGDLKRWRDWLESLSSLHGLRITRCVTPVDSVSGMQPELHMFSDASETGYGIACYARYQRVDRSFSCSLVLGKSRVAPLKSTSIPRLELTAATLAVRAARLLGKTSRNKASKVVFWTDSMTVLYYIANRTSRYSTFVSNRLATIQESTEPRQWKYVRSEFNPADYASRGLKLGDVRFGRWLNGPEFLYQEEGEPFGHLVPCEPPNTCEFKEKHVHNSHLADIGLIDGLFVRYSSWLKLLRAVVWLTRFKAYVMIMKGKRDVTLTVGNIKVMELRKATIDVVRIVQRQSLGEDYKALCSGELKGSSHLLRLNPFLRDGVMLVGGRLQHSQLGQGSKHPMILPSRHAVTDLVIRYYHETEGHAGQQHILALTRRKFWVLKGVSNIKRVIYNCAKCRRLRGRASSQLMAPLPASRVTPGNYPFEATGVDYFGPLYVKQGRALVKRYGCLFTCLKTRAVHIEIAQSLSTNSFILAFNRFINRRGSPSEMFSDNGSNFVGAESELRSSINELAKGDVSDRMAARDIQWNFNPPVASHRGGVWERVVRSIKEISRALSLEQVMNDESLLTLMTEVERIINNRPLVPVYDDAEEVVALTPNDLLVLRPVSELNLNELTNLDRYTRSWKQARQVADTFWKRWVKVYLPSLQSRSKWLREGRNFRPGDVVIIASDILSRANWPLGRVTAVHPGADGIVRKVTIKTRAGEVLRDIRKVCLLEGVDEYGGNGDDQPTRD